MPGLEPPLLAVVIPTLNEVGRIRACLSSVGRDPRVAVVVSDGGSDDGTPGAAAAWPGATVVLGPPGRGPQLNRGAAAAATPLLLFLHADCRLPGGWLEPLLESLALPDTALACFRLHTEPADGRSGSLRRRVLRLLDLRSRGPALPYGDQGFGLRREVFDRLGGFAPIPLMEDLDLARRARRVGRIRRLTLEVRTTARRFHRRPVLARMQTATFPVLFRLGVSARVLARWYGHAR